jgi:hypothetical protein
MGDLDQNSEVIFGQRRRERASAGILRSYDFVLKAPASKNTTFRPHF